MRICNQVLVVPVGTGSCRYQTVNPRSPYCIWHRLMRTRMADQLVAADKRLEAAADQVYRARVSPSDWPEGERWCAGCQSMVPLFYCTPAKGSTTLTRCRACEHRASTEHRDLRVYSVGKDAKKALEAKQLKRCAGCRNGQIIKDLAVDHNHKTGAPRGLLCQTCNHKVLGGAYDSAQILLNLAYYLLNPPAAEGSTWEPPENLTFELRVSPRPLKEPARPPARIG